MALPTTENDLHHNNNNTSCNNESGGGCSESSHYSFSFNALEDEQSRLIEDEICMQKFKLYETRLKFYMIGRDKTRTYWRVLKIDQMDPSEINICEASTTYSERECSDLLRRIHEGNIDMGGLKFVTTCYGIDGFIKFLGPYYILLITKSMQIGAVSGHNVYAVSKSDMTPITNPSVWPNVANSKALGFIL